jgi:hypothetical protein
MSEPWMDRLVTVAVYLVVAVGTGLLWLIAIVGGIVVAGGAVGVFLRAVLWGAGW